MADKAKTKKTSNAVETIVSASLPNAIKTLKGQVIDITPTHVVFKYQKPHSATFNQASIPVGTIIYLTGKKGKMGDITFITSGEIAKRTGVAEIKANGFIEITDTDRNDAPRTTLFNPAFASVVATGLEAPEPASGYVAKAKSKPKAEKKGDAPAKKKPKA